MLDELKVGRGINRWMRSKLIWRHLNSGIDRAQNHVADACYRRLGAGSSGELVVQVGAEHVVANRGSQYPR